MRPLSKPEQGLAMLLLVSLVAAMISTIASAQVFSGSGSGQGQGSIRFADAETPTATSTLVYQLARTPSPSDSLQVFLNGVLMKRGVDYTLSVGTVTFVSHYSAMLTDGGNQIVVFYRY